MELVGETKLAHMSRRHQSRSIAIADVMAICGNPSERASERPDWSTPDGQPMVSLLLAVADGKQAVVCG